MAWSEWRNFGSMEFKQCVHGTMKTSTVGAGVASTGTLNLPITLEKGSHKLVAIVRNYRGDNLSNVTSNITVDGYELKTDYEPKDNFGTLQKSLEITVDSETTLDFVFSHSSYATANHGEHPICIITDYV